MRFKVLFIQLLLVVAYGQPLFAQSQSPVRGPARVTAFVGVNVVPVDEERVLENHTVIVRDGRIVEIGLSAEVRVPPEAERIEGRGRYLLPGLVDMHAHLNSPHELPLYLANGVTTVFNLNGRPAHVLWRKRIINGQMLGPSIYTCGPTIRTTQKAEDARRIVDEQRRAGYDSIKVYNGVSKEAYEVIVAEAKKYGMLMVGHIPREPGLEGVLKAGQAIAHAEEYIYTFFKKNVDSYERIPEAATMTRDARVPVILTLVAFDHIIKQTEELPALLARPETRYLAPWVRDEWGPERNLYKKNLGNPEEIALLKKSLAMQKKLAQTLHQLGGRIFVGTDAMNMGVVPGFSAQEELHNLVGIGFTPFEAIRAATRYPAEFLAGNEFGTVAVGKRADLILVDGNPLRDINALTRPAGVMVRGRWLAGATLRRNLDEVPTAYTKEVQSLITTLERDADKAFRYVKDNDPFEALLNAAMTDAVARRGVIWFKNAYREARRKNQESPLVKQAFINALGYRLRDDRKLVKAAIEVFKFNTEAYPTSGNTYDSLAETYLAVGEKKLALEYYKKALEVEPKYPNAAAASEIVKKLEADLK